MGAFGAHALSDVLSARQADVWDTAVFYHLVHAPVLVLCGMLAASHPSRALTMAGWAFALGIVLFSGSLYVLALDGPAIVGPLTPLGGAGLIIGWLALGAGALRSFSR